MSSDSESKVVVAGSSAEDIVQRKKVKRSSVWEHFQEKDDTKAECIHCHHEFKTKYANTTGLLRHLKHMHPNISICTRKAIESTYDTRKIVESEDITEGIARMMVLDLRSFDTVDDALTNHLFLLPILSRIQTLSKISILSRISKFSSTHPDPEEISDPTRYFGFSHTSTKYRE